LGEPYGEEETRYIARIERLDQGLELFQSIWQIRTRTRCSGGI
jgi:hypothetical protein